MGRITDKSRYESDRSDVGRRVVSRRVFLKASAAGAAALATGSLSCVPFGVLEKKAKPVRFGIVTDNHYADIAVNGTRYFRQSLDKLAECTELMNAEQVDFLIELGDFKDQDPEPNEEKTIQYLDAVEKVFQQFDGPTFHVLGNHDMDSTSKARFLERVTNTGIDPALKYYSFDRGGFHFVVLDANYKADFTDYDHGNFSWAGAYIPPAELDWLRDDLSRTPYPTIVFVHQLLDGTGSTSIKNNEAVRAVLEASNKVLASFQGHLHKGSYSLINDIHYYTLKAVVEGSGADNNAYAIVEVLDTGDMIVTGYRKAVSREMPTPRAVSSQPA